MDIKKSVALLLLGVVVALSPVLYVRAAANPVITISNVSSLEYEKIDDALYNLNEDVVKEKWIKSDFLILTSSDELEDTINIEINMIEYNKCSAGTRQKIMEKALTVIHDSQISATNRNKIYNFIAEEDETTSSLVRQLSTDVSSDFAGAYALFRPFSGVVGTVIGILVLLIFLFLGFTVAIDLAFIVIPAFTLALQKANQDKGDKPHFVSVEAWNAMRVAEDSVGKGKYREPLGVYFQSKTKQFIALGVCILYLASGQIYDLIARIMDYFAGVLG